MRIKEQETKFKIEDVVWLMYNNRPVRAIVYGISYRQHEYADLSTTYISQSILNKIRSFFHRHHTKTDLWYEVQMVNEDGSYGGVGMFGYRSDNDIFATKEELIASLYKETKKEVLDNELCKKVMEGYEDN